MRGLAWSRYDQGTTPDPSVLSVCGMGRFTHPCQAGRRSVVSVASLMGAPSAGVDATAPIPTGPAFLVDHRPRPGAGHADRGAWHVHDEHPTGRVPRVSPP